MAVGSALEILPARMLGVADAAGNELFRRSMRTWRISLSGSAILSAALAAVFSALISGALLWTWAALGWLVYSVQALLCSNLERQYQGASPPPAWCAATLVLTICVGALWGSLVWWMPAESRSAELLGAFGTVMFLLGVSSASTSVGMLLAVLVPAGVMLASALTWHAGLPVAGGLSLLVLVLIVQHGRVLQANMLEVVRQRRQLQVLSDELQEQQAMVEQVSRERALAEERQRLLRDMHDGIGSSLIFAIKAIEQKRFDLDEASKVLRDCLDELRLVIDSLDPMGNDLVALLATLRYRLSHRLDGAGIELEWSVADVPPLPWLNAPEALDVLRIVQEAVANAIKHAGGRKLRIAVERNDGVDGQATGVVVLVEDDGQGLVVEQSPDGRGMMHMRQRAARLGATLEFVRSPLGGLGVCLHLPLEAPLNRRPPNSP